MPNQQNFNSNIQSSITSSVSSARFLNSRIVNVPNDLVLLERVNSAFGATVTDYIELHFYTIPTNALVLSIVLTPNDNFVSSHIVSHNDNTLKNYLRIEFTELLKSRNLILVPGDYYMVMNFFTEEIGNYSNRPLKIDKISSDRTEIEVSFVDNSSAVIESNTTSMREFVLPSFTKPSMITFTNETLTNIQSQSISLQKLTAQDVIQNNYIVPTYDDRVDEPNLELTRTLTRMDNLKVTNAVKSAISNIFNNLAQVTVQEIIDEGDSRIQRDQFEIYLREAVRLHIGRVQSLTGMGLLIS